MSAQVLLSGSLVEPNNTIERHRSLSVLVVRVGAPLAAANPLDTSNPAALHVDKATAGRAATRGIVPKQGQIRTDA